MLIIIDLHMFDLASSVSISDGVTTTTELINNNSLIDYALSKAEDASKICINGVSEYANNMKTQMELELQTKYSNKNNIEIEVL